MVLLTACDSDSAVCGGNDPRAAPRLTSRQPRSGLASSCPGAAHTVLAPATASCWPAPNERAGYFARRRRSPRTVWRQIDPSSIPQARRRAAISRIPAWASATLCEGAIELSPAGDETPLGRSHSLQVKGAHGDGLAIESVGCG